MKHFTQPRNAILRETDSNPSSCSPNPSSMKQKSSPSSSRKHKSSKENAPPSNFNLMSEYSASFATKPPLPAAAKSRSPLPPRPPSSNLNPLKRKLNMEVVPENLGSGFSDSGVKVVVRMRPLNKDEEEEMIVQKISSDTLSINGQSLTFDSVADTEATQLDIFQLVGAPLVENCLAGFNSSVFAYGQTGSGKTYTIWGPTNALSEEKQSNSQVGLTPRVFECLFARINEEQIKHADKQLQYQCRCSFLEIYNEQITDLLDPSQKNLQIREDVKCGVYVENLTEVDVWTLKDVTQLLMKGLSSRRIGATSINGESSRSHSVFTCMVESKCKSMADGMSSFKTSRINLVDLAGSERQKITGAAGDRLKEAGNINRSLSQLGNLINILAEVSQTGKQRHIPYRDSRLTFLLQESLGGNAKLAMICAISPAQSCKSETFSTLRFAQRAKAIKNKAVVNEVMQDDVNFLREVIRQLKDELHRMKANGNSSTSNGCYSTAWNARRSLNLLKLSLNRPLTLPHVEDDSDEEMEIDEENVEQSCHQVDLKLSRPEAKHPISGSSSMAIRDGHLVEPQLHASISGSAKNQDPKDTDLHMEEETCKQVENHESMNVDLASSESPPSEEKTLLGCSVRALENNESADNITVSADSSNHTPNETVSGVAPFDLGLVSCDVSPVLKSPTPSVSPRVSNSRKSLKTSFMLSASHKELNDDDIKIGSDIKDNTSSARSMQSGDLNASFGRRRNDLIKSSADLAASLHRGLEILESQRQGSAMRRSLFRSSFKPVDFKPILPIVKVDVGVQTCFQDNEKSDENSVAVLCSRRASQVEVRENEGRSLQLIPVDGSESADKLKVQVPKVVEKVLAGAIRREMALEEFSAKQASEITQLNRLVQQYKHERECNAIIGQTRDDKIRRLESLMDGILPVKDFMEEEFLALKHEHKLLEDKYDNHVELLSTKIELKRVQDELEQYHNFFDMGERDVLLEEIQDLRNQLRFYVDSLPPSTRKRSSLLELTYSREPNSGPPPLCAIPESTTDSSREQLERERIQWIEAESKWISLAEESKSELEASRTCAEKRRQELEAEKKCAEELKQAMQMAMEGHARMLEQYAELQEKHIAMLARHRKIQEGVGDVKRAAARAGVRGAESKFINALAAEVSALKVEREREKQHLRDENKGLQAQLRDTAEAVQAAGELLVRLKETEEAFAAAQKRALVAEKETEKANKQISKLKKRHEKEISALNQRLAESRLPKEALQPIYDGSNTAKHGPKEELHRWEEQVEPFCNGEDGELSKLVEPSWFSGYDRCNI